MEEEEEAEEDFRYGLSYVGKAHLKEKNCHLLFVKYFGVKGKLRASHFPFIIIVQFPYDTSRLLGYSSLW